MPDATLPDALFPWTTLTAVFLVVLGPAAGIPVVARLVRPRDQLAAELLDQRSTVIALALAVLATAAALFAATSPTELLRATFDASALASPASITAKLLALELVLLVLRLVLSPKHRAADGVVALALAANSAALAVAPGFVIARSWPSLLTDTAGAAALMLSTALVVGAAAKLALTHLVPGIIEHDGRFPERATRVMIAALVAELILTVAFSQVPRLDRSPHTLALYRLYGGAGAPIFWPFVVVIGVIAPGIALWFRAKTKNAALAIAAAAVIGVCALRWLLFTVH
ncbi:MAG: hypothetical protein A2138_08725 [Deltaproteobacteria bacterium RBG_16_71_12]|nr:MAG: hypothetical protein A2138_08725 [Deltaproteobacteria bacterium RBG_16_71_12]